MIVKGATFIHKTRLDPTWRPDVHKGEKYADAPHEIMKVFKVTGTTVWFGPVGARRSDTHMGRDEFIRTYGHVV